MTKQVKKIHRQRRRLESHKPAENRAMKNVGSSKILQSYYYGDSRDSGRAFHPQCVTTKLAAWAQEEM
eukprot:scaffold163955_cov36-Cyclotella_meneghiniana.AAC.1